MFDHELFLLLAAGFTVAGQKHLDAVDMAHARPQTTHWFDLNREVFVHWLRSAAVISANLRQTFFHEDMRSILGERHVEYRLSRRGKQGTKYLNRVQANQKSHGHRRWMMDGSAVAVMRSAGDYNMKEGSLAGGQRATKKFVTRVPIN